MLAYFIPAIIILGIITSYEDIKKGKIRNRWIVYALVFSAVINAVFLIEYGFSKDFAVFLVNLLASIIASFALWNFRFWSAGDAKLFIAYSALIPVSVYSNAGFFGLFPSFFLFINTMLPYFIFLLVKNLFTTPFKKIKKAFVSSAKSFPLLIVSLIGISWIAGSLRDYFFKSTNMLNTFIIYAVVYFAIDFILSAFLKKFKIKKIKVWHFYAILMIGRILANPGIISYQFLAGILATAVFYTLLLRTTYNIGLLNAEKKVDVKNLRVGDIVAEAFYEKKGKYFKKPVSAKDFFSKNPIRLEAEGLTEDEIKKIREMAKKHKLSFKTVAVYETVPFAPIMFLGVILTVLSNGIFINLFFYLF